MSSVPEWIQDAIFYQIFPDRFMNGDPENDPPHTLPWNACTTPHGFMGGDLRGITQRIDYLLDLGINAIYLNPIFISSSNHRYNTVDYYTIDPKLGTMQDFRHLIETAHRQSIRIILDGVFNHCGRGFFAFNDILENGPDSPYLDWFHIKGFPLGAYSPGEAKNYLAWWGYKSLPKFNTSNSRVRKYLFDIGRYWIENGADGWRLDVPNEIDDDSFWEEFRAVVRAANPDAYLVGEIWDGLPRWVGETHFDGLMNYPVRTAIIGMLSANWTPTRFLQALEQLQTIYPEENTRAMYVLLGSHDVERIRTMLNGDIQKLKLAVLFQFTYPGAPAVYYGDEIGLQGGKDPACRGGFPWDRSYWNEDLRAWFQQLISIRKVNIALRRGTFQPVLADDAAGVAAFARIHPEGNTVTVMNVSSHPAAMQISCSVVGWENGKIIRNLITDERIAIQDEQFAVQLEPWSGAIIA